MVKVTTSFDLAAHLQHASSSDGLLTFSYPYLRQFTHHRPMGVASALSYNHYHGILETTTRTVGFWLMRHHRGMRFECLKTHASVVLIEGAKTCPLFLLWKGAGTRGYQSDWPISEWLKTPNKQWSALQNTLILLNLMNNVIVDHYFPSSTTSAYILATQLLL